MLLRTKLIAGFSLLLALFLLSSYSSWKSQQALGQASKQILYLDGGTAQILRSNIAISQFITSQSKADAEAAHAFMTEASRFISLTMDENADTALIQNAGKLLQRIDQMQNLLSTQEQTVESMKATVAEAIEASGKASTAIARIVETNISNLRKEALPRRIEAADLLDKVKGFFLLGRNQFTTYRLNNSESAATECLKMLDESLLQTQNLERFFEDPRQIEQVRNTAQAIMAYKASFEKFIIAQTNMHKAQAEVQNQVASIHAESQNMVDAANSIQEKAQDRNELITLVFSFAAIALCVLVATLIIVSITRPLSTALQFAQSVANGDFTTQWNNASKDEFGTLAQSLNIAFAKVAEKAFWYESILNSLPFLLATIDTEKRFTFANTNVQKMLGKTIDQIVGQPCHTWGASICNTPNCAIDCIKDGKSEVPFIQPGMGHFKAIAVTLLDTNKKPMGFVDMVFDTNEEMRLKAEADDALQVARLQAVSSLEGITMGLNSAADQLTMQVAETNRGTEKAAYRITEIATAMEEMNATVLEVARSAGSASSVSKETKNKAEQGEKAVLNVVERMCHVEEQAGQLKNDMVQLEHHVGAIGSIMNVISDIADQTNLLALNAAIEAARAGEAGRGFAVVADEVRKLAEKTMQATVQVGNSIKSVQQSATHSLKSVDDSVLSIGQATALAHQAGEALTEIVHLVDSSADQVATIATAAEQQSATSEEINRALSTVNAAASESAHAMVQASQSVAGLTSQAHQLAQLMEDMKRS